MTINVLPENGTKYTLKEILSARAQHGEIMLAGEIPVKPAMADKTVGVMITRANKSLAGIDPKSVNHRNGETGNPRNGKPVKFPPYAEFEESDYGEISVKFLNTESPEISINAKTNMVTMPINGLAVDLITRINRDGLRKFVLNVAEMVDGKPIDVKWNFGSYGSTRDAETDAKNDILAQCLAKNDFTTIHNLTGDNAKMTPAGNSRRAEFLAKFLKETDEQKPESVETRIDATTNPKPESPVKPATIESLPKPAKPAK